MVGREVSGNYYRNDNDSYEDEITLKAHCIKQEKIYFVIIWSYRERFLVSEVCQNVECIQLVRHFSDMKKFLMER